MHKDLTELVKTDKALRTKLQEIVLINLLDGVDDTWDEFEYDGVKYDCNTYDASDFQDEEFSCAKYWITVCAVVMNPNTGYDETHSEDIYLRMPCKELWDL